MPWRCVAFGATSSPPPVALCDIDLGRVRPPLAAFRGLSWAGGGRAGVPLGPAGSRVKTTHFQNWDLVSVGAHSLVQDDARFFNVRQTSEQLILEECHMARPRGGQVRMGTRLAFDGPVFYEVDSPPAHPMGRQTEAYLTLLEPRQWLNWIFLG